MNHKIRLLCFLLFWEGNELSAFPSLFFTKEQISSISQNIFIEDADAKEKVSRTLSLSSLVFVDNEQWSLWVNNTIICPNTPHRIVGLQVENVTPQTVKFSWTFPETATPITFTLQPHQTYLLDEQKVIDGGGN